MKIVKTTAFAILALTLMAITACKNNSRGGFELKGTLEGIKDGKIVLTPEISNSTDVGEIPQDVPPPDTTDIRNGEFVFTGDIPEPAMYSITIIGREGEDNMNMCYFYAENAKMTLKGYADSLFQAKVAGGIVNEDQKRYDSLMMGLYTNPDRQQIINKYRADKSDANKKLVDSLSVLMEKEYNEITMDWIKKNPSSFYSAVLIEQLSYGQSANDIESNLKLLDPKLKDYKVVKDIYKLVDNLKSTDVGVSDFSNNAPDVTYTPDKSFAGKQHTDVSYLATLPGDMIGALHKDGTIELMDKNGKTQSKFKTALTSTPSCLAVDPSTGNLFVMGTINETKETKFRGKTYKIDKPKGVECLIYNTKGAQTGKLELKELKSATGAKINGDKLIVADFEQKLVAIYNKATGNQDATIKNMRACCKILDFGVTPTGEILVANLGAFRVQAFDYSGTIKYAFGKRGRTINDFHGCCNPVNVAYLANGGIVTVEKDPTRIKVYTKSGASQVNGIEDLVKGCTYIPMTSDSQNNLYLASANSGIVKCIAK